MNTKIVSPLGIVAFALAFVVSFQSGQLLLL